MTDCNIKGLQSTDTNSALSEIGVRINEDLKLAEHADQQVCKVPVNDSREVGPCALREV